MLTAVFFVAGEPYTPTTVAVQVDGPAAKAGLRTGDEVVRLGDSRVNRYEDIPRRNSSISASRCRSSIAAASSS